LEPFSPPQSGVQLPPPPPILLSQMIYHDARDTGSATRTSRSGLLLGATGSVPGWCGGYGGTPCFRKPDSSAIRGPRNLPRLPAWYLSAQGSLRPFLTPLFSPRTGVRLPAPSPIVMSEGIFYHVWV